MEELVVTETSCPDRAGLYADSRGSTFDLTVRI